MFLVNLVYVKVTKSYSKYFDRVIATLERLGLVVSVFSEYETIIGNSSAFRRSICLVYTDIIEFLTKSRKIFRKPGQNIGRCVLEFSLTH